MRDLATALDGHGGIKDITLNSNYTLTFTLADDTTITTTSVRGATGAKGDKGTDGRAITSVTKTGTSGLVDTYKIQFSDNTSTTFTVTNGSSIKSIAKTGTSGLVDTYTVTLTDNKTSTFTVRNGNGIASITLQSGTHAAGTTDVYKITFDNGQYTTFSVYNGLNGSGSVVSVNEKSPDAAGNVTLTASDVGAPTTEQFSTLQTTVNGKQPATNSLTAEAAIANADYFPFYDASAKADRKTLWSSIIAAIRTAFTASPLSLASGGTGAATAASARTNLGAQAKIKTASITLAAASWTGDGPYTQTVTISGVTAKSRIDLNPSAAVLAAAMDGGYGLVIGNNNGTIKAYAVGAKPTAAITVQVSITEVN